MPTTFNNTTKQQSNSNNSYFYLDISPSPVFIANSKGKFIYVNKAACLLLGYTFGELMKLSIFDIAKDLNEEYKNKWQQVITEGHLMDTELKLEKKDSGAVHIWLDAIKISDDEIIGYATDITERKKIEEKFKSIVAAAMDGFFMLDRKGNFIDVNEAYSKMVGYTQQELINGMSLQDVEVMENPDEISKHIDKIMKEGSERFLTKQKKKSGQIIEVEVSTTYISAMSNYFVAFARDITKQKSVEEELRHNNIRFSLAAKSAGIAVWEWDAKNNVLTWDDKMHELYEVDKDNFEGAYVTWISALHEDDKERLNNEINLALENKKDYNTEFRINLKNGKIKYLRAFAKTLRDKAGKATRMIGVNYDITELKKAQEELVASEQRFKTIFNDSLATMIIIDPATQKIVDVNKTAEKYYGYDKDEFIQLKITNLNLNTDEIINRDMQKTIKNQGGRFEFKHRLANGEIREVEVFSTPITIDGKVYLNSIVHDITDRKKAEYALIESEERYKNFFENDLTGDYLTTTEGKIIDCNPALVKILGYNSRSELLKANSTVFYPAKSDRNEFLKLISDEKLITNHQIRLKKKDGSIITCLENCIGIFNDDGKLTRLQGYLFDITEEIENTTALRESQQRFYSLFENMVEGFALHEVVVNEYGKPIDYLFLDVNPAYEKLTGLQKNNIVGKKVTEVLPGIENESAKWIEKYGNVAIDGEAIQFEDYSKSINKWYSITAYSPQEMQFAVIIEDITEDKYAEDQLKFQARLLEEIGESVIATNSEGKIIYWNHAAELLYGWKEEEVLGKYVLDVTPSDQSSEVATKVQSELHSGKRWSGEMILKKKNGETFDAFVTDSPFFDKNNKLIGIIGVSKDITELKNVEKDLRAKNEFIQTVLDNLPIGIALNQINDGKAVYMNKKFEEIYGWPAEDMQEIPDFFEHVYPDVEYREELVGKVLSDINSGDPKRMHWENLEITTKDNEKRKINAQNIPLFDQNTMVSTVLDITAERNAEKILVESQRLSAIGEMSSAIAHDFNNSLQSILGNLDLSLIHLNKNHPSRRYLETIRTSTTDAAGRVRLLQRFAGKSKSKDSFKELNVNQMIKDIIQQSRPLWKDLPEKDGILFKISTDFTNVNKVLGNEGELRSVLYNSLKNSIEAMPKGGNITIKTYHKNENVKILIVDEGIGMDEKTKARIFQPFFSTKGFESGRGLGMSGAYSIIKEHNGNIYIKESAPNKGTSLAIELPPTTRQDKLKTSDKVVKKYEGTASILWVDDDESIRKVAHEMLEAIGYKGTVVASGNEAIEKLKKDQFDLVITDIGMPNMNGWELISEIKESIDDNLEIAVLTGWGDQIGDEEKKKYQIKHVISKPFRIDQLNSIISYILSEDVG